MNLQKNTSLNKNKILNHNKKPKILSFFSLNYSNCHPTYGDLDDKENIN